MTTRPIAEIFVAALLAGIATAALILLMHVGSTPEQPLMRLERVLIVGKSTAPLLPSQQLAQRTERLDCGAFLDRC